MSIKILNSSFDHLTETLAISYVEDSHIGGILLRSHELYETLLQIGYIIDYDWELQTVYTYAPMVIEVENEPNRFQAEKYLMSFRDFMNDNIGDAEVLAIVEHEVSKFTRKKKRGIFERIRSFFIKFPVV